MSIEVDSVRAICSKCGTDYSRQHGNFPVSYAQLHKGVCHTHVCRKCIDEIYNTYFAQCQDAAKAVRQVCRKLDLYWNEKAFQVVEKKSTARSMMTRYMSKITCTTYAGKSYDDTLLEEGTLWNFGKFYEDPKELVDNQNETDNFENEDEDIEFSEDVVSFWGRGYNNKDYKDLEDKRANWLSSFSDGTPIGVSMESHIKQICLLELDMDKQRAKGHTVSDKTLKAYTDLLGSANLKPVQKQKEDSDLLMNSTPMGVWLYRFENKRPLPEDKYKDSRMLKYVFTWMGHVLHMLGKKNGYEELYQKEIDRLRVSKPEYDGDDESLMMDYMNEDLSDEHDDVSIETPDDVGDFDG